MLVNIVNLQMLHMSIAERIAQIQKSEGQSASSFADILGVQRSGLSHIYSGRNKPSIDFIQKLLLAFPAYNAAWVINGTLPMRNHANEAKSDDLSLNKTVEPSKEPDLFSMVESEEPAYYGKSTAHGISSRSESSIPELPMDNRKLKQVILIYDDHTFESFLHGN